MPQIARSPGRLSRRARNHFDLRSGPEVRIESKVKPMLARKLDRELVSELTHILEMAGYAGVFQLILIGSHKGSMHTRGIRFREVQASGIGMTMHGHRSSNDANIECVLLKPREFDALKFFTTLKQTQEALRSEEEIETGPDMDVSGDNVVRLHARQEPMAPGPDSKSESANRSPKFGLFNDPELQQLFIEEVKQFADTDGVVARECVFRILVQEFGIHQKGVWSTTRSLMNRNILEPAGGDAGGFMVHAMPAPGDIGSEEGASPMKSEAASANADPQADSLSTRFDHLVSQASIATEAQLRLEQVTGEIVQAEARLAELSAERCRIEAKLAEPGITGAQSRLQEVKLLLGLS